MYDYPQIITKMMDLGTIKRRLERNHYSTAHQVAQDIRLIWSNCMTYNADGSDFWLLGKLFHSPKKLKDNGSIESFSLFVCLFWGSAKSYSRRFEDRYRKVKAEFDVGEDLVGVVTTKEENNPNQSLPTKRLLVPRIRLVVLVVVNHLLVACRQLLRLMLGVNLEPTFFY